MPIIILAIKSLRNRWFTISLTIISISLSVALFLGVERIRHEAQAGFTNTVSGTDLIVGSRTSPVQLLLASVFRLSDLPNNISWESYLAISTLPSVKWSIPVSLGDAHKGYRVLGTNEDYLNHLQFGNKQHLSLKNGKWFDAENGAVIGSEVADVLGYSVGSSIVVSHGSGDVSFLQHDQHPFNVTGIFQRTGTPVDRTVHVNLTGIDAIHADSKMAESHNHDPLAGVHHEPGHYRICGTRWSVDYRNFCGIASEKRRPERSEDD